MAASDAKPVPRKNTAFRLYFTMMLNTGKKLDSADGLASYIVKDAASSAATTNAAVFSANGWYYVDLTAAEMNADCVMITVVSSTENACDELISLYPAEAGDIQTDVETVAGTAQTAGNLAALITTVDTVADAIKAKTDNLPAAPAAVGDIPSSATITTAVWAAGTRTLTAGTNIVLAKGTGVTGFNDLSEANVRNAVGLSLANLDSQFSDIPGGVWSSGGRELTDKTGFTLEGTVTNLDDLIIHGNATWATASGFATPVEVGDIVANNVSSLPTNVWANATRTLTAGTNIVLAKGTGVTGFNDITAASVWAVATRALTDKAGFTISGTTTTLDALQTALNSAHGAGSWATATGFSTLTEANVRSAVGLGSANLDTQIALLAPAATALSTAVWTGTKAGYLDAAISSISGGSGGATAGEIADAVWTGATRTLTSIDLEVSGLTADQSNQLEAIYLRTTDGVIVTSPVNTGGTKVNIVRGDDYLAEDGRSIDFTAESWPILTGGTAVLKFGGKEIEGDITAARAVSFDVASADTTDLTEFEYPFQVVATLATSGNIVTLARGRIIIAASL